MLKEVIELRELRKKRALSRAQLARILGIPEFSIYRWEVGKTNPRSLYLEKLRGVLKRLKRTAEDNTDSNSNSQDRYVSPESPVDREDWVNAKKQ